jgi:hypothetical protein
VVAYINSHWERWMPPKTSGEVFEYLSRIGKMGGASKSPKKRAASKRNADKAWRARWKDRPQKELWPPELPPA